MLADFAKTKKRQLSEPSGPESAKRAKPELTAAGKAKAAPKPNPKPNPKVKAGAKSKSK